MSKQISVLQDQVANNHKFADLVLIEIRALLTKSLAKIQLSPKFKGHGKIKETILRQVKVKTRHTGSGEKFIFPLQPDFNNPIVAVYGRKEKEDIPCNFETKDGE